MEITVNGTAAQPSDSSTVLEVLASRMAPEETVIVLLNGEMVSRELWGSTALKMGDNVEVISVLGGG